MMKTSPTVCAIYARTSTGAQKEEKTIESQLAELPAYAKQQGWHVYDTYIDDGTSGSSIEGRQDFQRLLVDMQGRKFDILLVIEHSRVTRTDDPAERGLILGALKSSGVKLASPAEGLLDLSMFTGELLTTLKLMFAAEERREIAERMRRGKLAKLRDNIFCLPYVPYGLKRVTDRNVHPVRHKLMLNEEEANILRLVYDLVVGQKKTLHYAADYLNKLGYKSRRGKRWSPGILAAILKAGDRLTGEITTNKYEFKLVDGRSAPIGLRPESEWVKVKVPAVFTKAEYRKLRKRIDGNKSPGRPGVTEASFLLRGGKVRCGLCGRVCGPRWTAPKNHKPAKYYVCGGRLFLEKFKKPTDHRCALPYVHQQVLDDRVWEALIVKLLMHPQQTLKDWAKAVDAKRQTLDSLESRLERVEKEVRKKEEQQDRLLDQSIAGLFPADKVRKKKAVIDKTLGILQGERRELREKIEEIQSMAADEKAVRATAKDLKKLAKKLGKKMYEMELKDRQKLIDYVMNGAHVVVYPRDEVEVIELGLRSKLRIKWDFQFKGVFDIRLFTAALKAYDETGTIPDKDYLITKNNG